MSNRCGQSSEAAEWRERLDAEGVDFDREAVLILWSMIGTAGTPSIHVAGPDPSGLVTAEIRWDIPSGPARPVATAACYGLAIDRARATRAVIERAGEAVVSLELGRSE